MVAMPLPPGMYPSALDVLAVVDIDSCSVGSPSRLTDSLKSKRATEEPMPLICSWWGVLCCCLVEEVKAHVNAQGQGGDLVMFGTSG